MANYNGTIANNVNWVGAVRDQKRVGGIVNSPSILKGKRSTVKSGLDLGNYYFVKFERIPKERILNRFKNLGGNIQY